MVKQEAKPMTVLKEFFSKPEHFADVINAVFFDGKEVICPEMLEEADTDVSSTIRLKGKTISLERFRDVVKKTMFGCEYVIIGVENQMKTHYGMPLRTMIYDALNYLKQCEELKEKHKKEKKKGTSAEFLSDLEKGERLKPVFTLVIYYGDEEWDGPLSLKDMVNIPPGWELILSDYQMNLLEVRKSGQYHFKNKEVDEVFEISRIIFDKNYDILKENYGNAGISMESALAVGAITGSARLMKYVEISDEEEINMCKAWKELEAEWEAEGREEVQTTVIKNMLNKGFDIEEIAEMVELPIETVQKIKEEMQVTKR